MKHSLFHYLVQHSHTFVQIPWKSYLLGWDYVERGLLCVRTISYLHVHTNNCIKELKNNFRMKNGQSDNTFTVNIKKKSKHGN